MAEFRYRHPENAPGKFYTDGRCLDCDFCREIAPEIFRRNDVNDSSYVAKQPSTPEEVELCEDCASRCPCNAIGDDGDLYDWNAAPDEIPAEITETRIEKKVKWKFW